MCLTKRENTFNSYSFITDCIHFVNFDALCVSEGHFFILDMRKKKKNVSISFAHLSPSWPEYWPGISSLVFSSPISVCEVDFMLPFQSVLAFFVAFTWVAMVLLTPYPHIISLATVFPAVVEVHLIRRSTAFALSTFLSSPPLQAQSAFATDP